MEDTFFMILRRKIAERKQSAMEYLAHGGADSYEQYMRSVGAFHELTVFEEELKELEQRFIAE